MFLYLMNRLKDLRKRKKLTQQELADIIGVTKLTILRWEKGDRQIKPDKAQLLAEFFGVDVGYLLGYYDDLDSALKKIKQSDENEESYFKAFKAYYELKKADGQEFLISYKGVDFLEKYREKILTSLVPDFDKMTNEELEHYLLDKDILNQAEQKFSDFLFTIGTMEAIESRLFMDFIFLTDEDKNIILKLLNSLTNK